MVIMLSGIVAKSEDVRAWHKKELMRPLQSESIRKELLPFVDGLSLQICGADLQSLYRQAAKGLGELSRALGEFYGDSSNDLHFFRQAQEGKLSSGKYFMRRNERYEDPSERHRTNITAINDKLKLIPWRQVSDRNGYNECCYDFLKREKSAIELVERFYLEQIDQTQKYANKTGQLAERLRDVADRLIPEATYTLPAATIQNIRSASGIMAGAVKDHFRQWFERARMEYKQDLKEQQSENRKDRRAEERNAISKERNEIAIGQVEALMDIADALDFMGEAHAAIKYTMQHG